MQFIFFGKTTCAFKVALIYNLYINDKDDEAGIPKEMSGISYCILYITRFFMLKVY